MVATKHKTLDTALNVNGNGEEGKWNPNIAQTANTKNMPASENRVALEILGKGDATNSPKEANSKINRGKKNSRVYCVAGSGE